MREGLENVLTITTPLNVALTLKISCTIYTNTKYQYIFPFQWFIFFYTCYKSTSCTYCFMHYFWKNPHTFRTWRLFGRNIQGKEDDRLLYIVTYTYYPRKTLCIHILLNQDQWKGRYCDGMDAAASLDAGIPHELQFQ